MASYRTLARAGVYSVLTAYAAANPTLLRGTTTARPASLSTGELPCAWIDAVNAAAVRHFNSIRQQDLEVIVTLADVVPDSQEEEARADVLIDALMDAFTAGYHTVDGFSIAEVRSYTSRLIEEGAVPYAAVDFSVIVNTAEGRTP